MITLNELRDLITFKYIKDKKIEAIKYVRGATGADLRSAKDFVEQTLFPTLENQESVKPIATNYDPEEQDDFPKEENLDPPMYIVGHTYAQLDGNMQTVLGTANKDSSYETVYSIDRKGNIIHRYNRRDFGRVTGCEPSDPRNFKVF